MALISDLLPEVLVEASGCPNLLATRALRRAAREFCKQSGYWRAELTSTLTLEDATPEYSLTDLLPSDAVLDGVLSVIRESDGEEVKSKSPLQLDAMSTDWRDETGEPEFYTQFAPTSIRIVPYPTTTTDSLRILARYTLSRTATTIPDVVLDRYDEGIFAGAVANLLQTPKQPWSNATRALDFEAQFQAAIAEAQSEAERFFSRRRTGTVRYGGI